MKVLVAGATGLTGQRLMSQLDSSAHHPIAMVREESDTSNLPENVETRIGDLTDLNSEILNDVDAVVFAAGSGGDTSAEMTDKVDRDGAIALVDAAAARNVKRFVMLSSIGADNPEKAPDEMQHYLDAKHQADEHLKKSGLDYTIVRPVALTKDGPTGAIVLGDSVDRDTKATRGDVAQVLAMALTENELKNETVEMHSQ